MRNDDSDHRDDDRDAGGRNDDDSDHRDDDRDDDDGGKLWL